MLWVTDFTLCSCSQFDELESIDLTSLSTKLIEWQLEQGYTTYESPFSDATDIAVVDDSDLAVSGSSGESKQPQLAADSENAELKEFLEFKRYKALQAKFGRA